MHMHMAMVAFECFAIHKHNHGKQEFCQTRRWYAQEKSPEMMASSPDSSFRTDEQHLSGRLPRMLFADLDLFFLFEV